METGTEPEVRAYKAGVCRVKACKMSLKHRNTGLENAKYLTTGF